MKIKIKAEKTENKKWHMVAVFADGNREYPQEGLEHDTRKEVIDQAKLMYKHPAWEWNERNHTIVN